MRVLERKVGSELGRALNASNCRVGLYFVCHLCMNFAYRRIFCDDVCYTSNNQIYFMLAVSSIRC